MAFGKFGTFAAGALLGAAAVGVAAYLVSKRSESDFDDTPMDFEVDEEAQGGLPVPADRKDEPDCPAPSPASL